MKKQKPQVYITTMSKEKFDALPKYKKCMVVAQDVIDRIKLKQIAPRNGHFCSIVQSENWNLGGKSLKGLLESPKTQCTVCAKGGLFLSYIGIVNNYDISDNMYGRFSSAEELKSEEMGMLTKIFTRKQLSLIESCYEGKEYEWNDFVTMQEFDKCLKFRGYDYYENTDAKAKKLLQRICENIIKNKGTFKP